MSPPFLPAPFVCYPAAVRLPLVTVPEGQQLYSWFWNVANARYCFRTLAYNREPFHTCFLSFLDFPSTSTAPVRPDRTAKGSQEGT